MKYILLFNGLLFIILFFYGCGASTASRYEKDEEQKDISVADISEETLLPPFDMTPYQSRFNFDITEETYEGEIWYEYDTLNSGSDINLVEKEGYRVEVLTTDDLEEANNMRSELRFGIRQNVYIIFDPPFYRVRTGDFESRNAAENLIFKLRQLGYQESRIVSDIIKVEEKP
jgi:hypothetical protein